MDKIKLFVKDNSYLAKAEALAVKTNGEIVFSQNDISENDLVLVYDISGISLVSDELTLMGDFTKLLPRIKSGVVNSEILVKAARIKGRHENLTAFDATAGLGEDSLLLAAAGFQVTLCEYDPVIAELLKDTIERALKHPMLENIVKRMSVIEGDSIKIMQEMANNNSFLDVVLLDPMFPERNKSALIGKKFQLLQRLECPCNNEVELLKAAMDLKPRKLVIKRPVKGKLLADMKPEYVISGKAVRYDCFTYTR